LKRAVFYLRVSTLDQHPETQRHDLRQLAEQRGFDVVEEYVDHGVSGARVKRPALDRLLRDARRGRFQVVVVWAADRLARSVKHFLELLDEFQRLGIEFVSMRESLDTAGPLGRAVMIIVSAVAELERSLIRERVRAGMRRAQLEGQKLGRPCLELDRLSILRDRARGMSLGQLARLHRTSRTTIRRILHAVPKTPKQTPSQLNENTRPDTAA